MSTLSAKGHDLWNKVHGHSMIKKEIMGFVAGADLFLAEEL